MMQDDQYDDEAGVGAMLTPEDLADVCRAIARDTLNGVVLEIGCSDFMGDDGDMVRAFHECCRGDAEYYFSWVQEIADYARVPLSIAELCVAPLWAEIEIQLAERPVVCPTYQSKEGN